MLTPLAKSGLRKVGKEAVRLGTGVAADALAGADPLESLETRGREGAARLLHKLNKSVNKRTMKGGAKKRRRGTIHKGGRKKRRLHKRRRTRRDLLGL